MKKILIITTALTTFLAGCNYDDAFRAADSAARSYYSRPPSGYTPTYQYPIDQPEFQ